MESPDKFHEGKTKELQGVTDGTSLLGPVTRARVHGSTSIQSVGAIQLEELHVRRLSYPGACLVLIKQAGNYIIARGIFAGVILGNAVVITYFSPQAVIAAPLITTMHAMVMGTMRGTLFATGIISGQLNGEGKFKEIGQVNRHGWVMSVILSIPADVILLNAHHIYHALGASDAVTQDVQSYFYSYIWAEPGILFLTCDYQLALAAKKTKVLLISGISFSALSALFGYLLALGPGPFPRLEWAGLGYGTVIATYVTLGGVRLYFYRSSDFEKFKLFAYRSHETFYNRLKTIGRGLLRILKLGSQLGAERFGEWFNLWMLSVLALEAGEHVLIAEQVAVEPMKAVNLILLAMVQSTGVVVANAVGQSNRALQLQDPGSYADARENARRLGNVSIITGVGLAAIGTAIIVPLRNQLIQLLTHDHKKLDQSTIVLAQAAVLYFGIRLLVDVPRNNGAGALRGFKDALYAPILSFIFMSLLMLPLGGVFTLVLDWGAEWLFITQDIGVLLAAVAIVRRWLITSRVEDMPELIEEKTEEEEEERDENDRELVNPARVSSSLLYECNSSPRSKVIVLDGDNTYEEDNREHEKENQSEMKYEGV